MVSKLRIIWKQRSAEGGLAEGGRAYLGPLRDAAWEAGMFVKIYETYADLYARLRRKRSSTLFHLPVMMLMLRAACEELFRDMYPSYTRTNTGACIINRPCAQQYVGKSQSCMVISGRLIVHAPVQAIPMHCCESC